jgi:hypothetical protein
MRGRKGEKDYQPMGEGEYNVSTNVRNREQYVNKEEKRE